MDIRAIRVVRMAAGEDAAAWRDALATPGRADAAAVLKEDRGSWVRRANLLGRDVVVKCRELNTIGRRFKHAIGMGHGAKHWRGAGKLMGAGIATGKPLVLMRAEVDGRAADLLVMEFVPGETLLNVLDAIAHGRGPGVREQHAIARAVGASYSNMLKSKLWNGDHKPSNLIVSRADDGAIGIAIIDCVAIYSLGFVDHGEGEDMAAALIIEPTGCGCPPRRSLWLRGLIAGAKNWNARARQERRDVGRWILIVENMILAHGDPRPRVNPLTANRQGSR